MTTDDRITQQELQQIFGPEMPWEAYAYLFGNNGAGPDDDLTTVRAKLKEMARGMQEAQSDAEPDLVDQLRQTATILPHDVYTWLHPLLTRAADEIERLRASA